jgi:hypothetical protein
MVEFDLSHLTAATWTRRQTPPPAPPFTLAAGAVAASAARPRDPEHWPEVSRRWLPCDRSKLEQLAASDAGSRDLARLWLHQQLERQMAHFARSLQALEGRMSGAIGALDRLREARAHAALAAAVPHAPGGVRAGLARARLRPTLGAATDPLQAHSDGPLARMHQETLDATLRILVRTSPTVAAAASASDSAALCDALWGDLEAALHAARVPGTPCVATEGDGRQGALRASLTALIEDICDAADARAGLLTTNTGVRLLPACPTADTPAAAAEAMATMQTAASANAPLAARCGDVGVWWLVHRQRKAAEQDRRTSGVSGHEELFGRVVLHLRVPVRLTAEAYEYLHAAAGGRVAALQSEHGAVRYATMPVKALVPRMEALNELYVATARPLLLNIVDLRDRGGRGSVSSGPDDNMAAIQADLLRLRDRNFFALSVMFATTAIGVLVLSTIDLSPSQLPSASSAGSQSNSTSSDLSGYHASLSAGSLGGFTQGGGSGAAASGAGSATGAQGDAAPAVHTPLLGWLAIGMYGSLYLITVVGFLFHRWLTLQMRVALGLQKWRLCACALPACTSGCRASCRCYPCSRCRRGGSGASARAGQARLSRANRNPGVASAAQDGAVFVPASTGCSDDANSHTDGAVLQYTHSEEEAHASHMTSQLLP